MRNRCGEWEAQSPSVCLLIALMLMMMMSH